MSRVKKYTQADFENFEVIDGRLQCPTGDYTDIQKFPADCDFGLGCGFGERCSFSKCCRFGEHCRFGERCSFGEFCSFSKFCSFGEFCRFGERCNFGKCCIVEGQYTMLDYVKFDRFGSENRATYIYLTDKGLYVRCGCFAGPIDAFASKIKDTHGDNQYAKEYLMMIEIAKLRLQKGAKSNA